MKTKLLFALLALLGMSQAVAQEYEYVPFVREGVKWVYYYDFPFDNSYIASGKHYYTLEIKGDTILIINVTKRSTCIRVVPLTPKTTLFQFSCVKRTRLYMESSLMKKGIGNAPSV